MDIVIYRADYDQFFAVLRDWDLCETDLPGSQKNLMDGLPQKNPTQFGAERMKVLPGDLNFFSLLFQAVIGSIEEFQQSAAAAPVIFD